MIGWLVILAVAGLSYLLYTKPGLRKSIADSCKSLVERRRKAPAKEAPSKRETETGWKLKLFLMVIVLWEGIFGFYAMTDAARPSGLGFIPHWGTPTMATAGEWIWANWLGVLVVYGSVMGLLAILSKGTSWEKEAKAMRAVATASVVAAFLGLPLLSEAPRLVVAERICPAASAFQTRTCNADIRWSAGFSIDPKEGIADNGMHLCRTPGGHMQKSINNGTTFFQVRSDDGTIPVSYRLYPRHSACPDILPS